MPNRRHADQCGAPERTERVLSLGRVLGLGLVAAAQEVNARPDQSLVTGPKMGSLHIMRLIPGPQMLMNGRPKKCEKSPVADHFTY